MQLNIQASDQALPAAKTSTVQLIVTVPRDTRAPEFEQDRYEVDITEDKEVNTRVIDINARDELKV